MTKAMHRIQRKNKFLPYLLTLPSMLLFSMFTFYPFFKDSRAVFLSYG